MSLLKNKNFILNIFLVLIISLFYSCAQIGTPSGGEYDRIPPRALHYSPDSAGTHFNARTIKITFDEYIQPQGIDAQLLISPPLEYVPEIIVNKKTVAIQLDKKEALKPNTTYVISLGAGIKDIHEGTAIDNFNYVFSTGDYIDSLTLSGNVLTAFDHKAEKDLFVMLYSDLSDSAIYKGKPDFFAKTNTVGAFNITNIRNGSYRMIALKDLNGDFKYNEGEQLAFLDSIINPAITKEAHLYLFTAEERKLYLKKSAQQQYGKFQLVFNKGSDSIHIHKLNGEQLKGVKYLTAFSKYKDTLTYWIDPIDNDSLILQIKNGAIVIDTVRFKLIKKEAALKSKSSRSGPFKLSLLNTLNAPTFDLNRKLMLLFSNPIETVNNAAIQLKEDTLAYTKYPLMYDKPAYPNDTVLILSANPVPLKNTTRNPLLKENTSYSLFIPPGTFTDFYGLSNDSIHFKFKTREERFYGTLKLRIEIEKTSNQYIVQVLNDKEEVVRTQIINSSEEVYFDYLFPANYKIKLIVDRNKNGKWDTGNYLKKIQPETVIYNQETINIRSNWDLELEWKIIDPH